MKKLLLLVLLAGYTVYPQEVNQKFVMDVKSSIAASKIGLNENVIAAPDLPGRKNPGLAIIFSLALPGMGELYAGDYSSGKYFTAADVFLWGAVFGLNSYGSAKRDNYKAFAQTWGGINPEGKDETFYANLCDYVSMDDYNRAMDLQREYDLVYKTQSFNWNWGADDKRKEYKSMWRASEQAFNNIRFAVGALLLNRLMSVINAVRLVSNYNKNLELQKSVEISFSPNYLAETAVGISLNLRASF